mgnify:CR=1 FL=1
MTAQPRPPQTPAERPRVELDRDSIELALLGPPTTMGRRDVSRATGASILTARRFWHAMGFPLVQDEDALFTEADRTALADVGALVRAGAVDEELALAMTRALARTMDRLALWQTQLTAEYVAGADPVDDEAASATRGPAGLDPETAADAAVLITSLADDIEPLVTYVWRRQLAQAVSRMLSDAAPEAESGGMVRAVGFADLVGFTAIVNRLSERELGVLVQRFEVLCSDVVTAHGGRVVKTVGDEVMFQTTTVGTAAAIATDLVAAIGEDDLLPPVRLGMALGAVLPRLGDVFGTTVNRASRLTAVAEPGMILVDDAFAGEIGNVSGFVAVTDRPRELRGIGEVVPSRLMRSRGARAEDGPARFPLGAPH